MSVSIWRTLGIDAASDRDTIRRAYARKLKITNPEDDPEGFKALRAAYEAALDSLRAAEWTAQWEETGGSDEAAPGDVPEIADPHHPATSSAPGRPAAEADARTRALTELQQRIDALARDLDGPWGSQDKRLKDAFEAVLDAPLMADISIHAEVEAVLAAMLANAIPRSDVLLLAAIDAFSWEGAAQARNGAPAVTAILDRIEEWRLISAIQERDHGLNDAWRALTRPPAAPWHMRLLALKPGLAGRVQLLLSHADHQAIGLSHSFSPRAVAWWEDFLSRPRLGLGVLAAVPLGLGFALLVAWALSGGPVALRLGVPILLALTGLAWPIIYPRLLPVRQRLLHEADYGRWRIVLRCWPAAAALLPFAAMALPATPWALLLALAASFLLILWPVLSAWEPVGDRTAVRWHWLALQFGLFALLAGPVLGTMPPVHLAIFCAVSCVLLAVRLAFIRSAAAFVGALTPHFREAVIMAVTIGAAVAAHAIGKTVHAQTPAYHGFLVIGAILLITAAAERADAQSPSVALYWFVRIAAGIALFVIIADSTPDRPAPAPESRSPAIDVRTLDERVAGRLGALEAGNPGIRSIRLRNPEIYGQLRAAIVELEAGRRSAAETASAIDKTIDDAYGRLLPDASNALLVEHFRLRQMRLQGIRAFAPELCVDESRPVDPTLLPASYRTRAQWLVYAVVSKSSYGSSQGGGKPIDMNRMSSIAAERLRITPQELGRRIAARGTDPKAACAAKIAVLNAIAAQPIEDIAGFVRGGLVEAQRAGRRASGGR